MHFSFNFGWHTITGVKVRKSKWVLWAFQMGSLGGGGAASLFAYLWVPRPQPKKKKSVLTFLGCLKWIFQPVFSSFNSAFWFHLITSKWDQERVLLVIQPSWTRSGWGRVEYLNHDEWKFWQIYGLKWKSETRTIR